MSMTMTYEEQRILGSLAARSAVLDLAVRQHRAFEAGDLETWIGTFVVSGVLELPGADPLVGHASLGRWFATATRGRRVLVADPVVEIDGVHGTQRSTLVIVDLGAPGRAVRGLTDTEDELIYERGRWYFARRRLHPLSPD